VRLFSDDEPLAPGFNDSAKSWVRGETVIPLDSIERIIKVETVGSWHGHRFEIGVIVGRTAYVTYLGKDFDEVCHLPGMQRPDKFEVTGEIPVEELTDVEERIVDVPLVAKNHHEGEGGQG
jgi:hypothetical protein